MTNRLRPYSLSTQWKLAFRNLIRNKRRNIATISTVAVGYIGLLLLGGYIIRVNEYLKVNSVYLNHLGHLSIYKTGGLDRAQIKLSKYGLSVDEQNLIEGALRKIPGVEFVGKYLIGIGLLGNGHKSIPFVATGVEPEHERLLRTHPKVQKWTPEIAAYKKGKGLWEYRVNSPDVLPNSANQLRYEHQGESPNWIGTTSNWIGTTSALAGLDSTVQLAVRDVHGDLAAADAVVANNFTTGMSFSEDTAMVAPLHLLQRLYDTQKVTYIAAYLKDDSQTSRVLNTLKSALGDLSPKLDFYPYYDERTNLLYVGTMSFLAAIAAFFVFLVAGVVIFSIINSLTMSIIERVRELGAMRSMGFTPRFIAGLFLREGFVLSFLGIGAGILGAHLIAMVVNLSNLRFRPPGIAGDMQFMITPDAPLALVLAIILSVTVSATAYFTSFRKMKRSAAELLSASSA